MSQMIGKIFYDSVEWFETKMAVDERNGPQCRICGSLDRVTPHHIVPRKYKDDVDWDIDQLSNLVNICWDCHKKADRKVEPRSKPTHDMRIEECNGKASMDIDIWVLI